MLMFLVQVEVAKARSSFKDRKKRKIGELKAEELKKGEKPLEGMIADPVCQIRAIAIGGVLPEVEEYVQKLARFAGEVRS